jgi:glycosyltransferase involved in cell wall biosynthesis
MRALLRRIYNQISCKLTKLYTSNWKPYSHLIIGGDNANWVLDWEMREISRVACQLGIQVLDSSWQNISVNQSIFLADQFFLRADAWLNIRHRIGFSYFHGLPNTGEPAFDEVYAALNKYHARISRIQASHTQMQDVILQTGIDPAKVFLIPIGVNLDFFPFRSRETIITAREKLNIPQSAFVIGSFQKDGNGWEEGLEPKLVKGPDIFLSVIKELKVHIPELYVLLTGPARGYVKAGLESMQVKYSHFYLNSYPEIGRFYQALNLYLVTARQEGGPKAVLESMASGVPIISTRVGQAMDLIQHGQNGWLAEVLDVEALCASALHVYHLDESELQPILSRGRATAEANSYPAQVPLWKKFMDGFVE